MAADDDELDAALGAKIKAARRAAGLSLRTLSERCGLSYSFLSDLENGKRSISVRNLYALAFALNCRPATLLPDGEADWLDNVGSL